jgi:lysophospholipase L1-like esterase
LLTQLVLAQIFLVATSRNQLPSSPPSIAIVGDSFAAGALNRVVWPTLLAQRSGWAVSNVALPGAGFVADGRGGYAYTYQVDRAQAAHPRAIVITTGLADTGLADTGPMRIGAIDAINKIKLGGQQALVIGPTWYEPSVPDAVRRVSDTVQQVAAELDVPFLDALHPPWLNRDEMQVDVSGPNDEGQSVIADKVGAWLRDKVVG